MNTHFVLRHACPACRSTMIDTIYRNPFTRSPVKEYLEAFYSRQGRIEFGYLEEACYVLVNCRVCGLIFQEQIPNECLMQILYDRWIDPQVALERHERLHTLDMYARYAENAMQVIAYFGTRPQELTCLDYGMGWGKWARMVGAFGCNSYGFDLSLSRTAHTGLKGVEILDGNELDSCRFDFINADWVFEHIPNPLETLTRLKLILKPRGVLRISVPMPEDIERRLKIMDWNAAKDTRNSLNPVAPLEHINCFRRKTLLTMASMTGMKEVFLPVRLRFQLARGLNTLRRAAKNVLLPVFPGLARGYAFLTVADRPS